MKGECGDSVLGKGTEFQFCKMKSSGDGLPNNVSVLNTPHCTLVVNVFMYFSLQFHK